MQSPRLDIKHDFDFNFPLYISMCMPCQRTLIIFMQRYQVPLKDVTSMHGAMMESMALDAARAGRPLPSGFTLPKIGEQMKSIYQALRNGESLDAVAQVWPCIGLHGHVFFPPAEIQQVKEIDYWLQITHAQI